MLEMTDGYKSAIVGDVREMYLNAVLEIVDPDIQYQASSGSGSAPFGKSAQLFDKNFSLDPAYATLEKHRWILDGSFRLVPDNPAAITGEVGHVGNVLSDEDGAFPPGQYAEIKFANVSILQALSVFFSDKDYDGIPVDFSVSVWSAGQEIYKKEYAGNAEKKISVSGFTVYDPDAIRVTVARWSLPNRRLRVAEIIPGIYEQWTEDTLASIDIQQHGNFSCLSIPYGTCTLRMDNVDRRFEPRNREGVFQSIEDRQGIPIKIGVRLADGSVDYKQVGVFYQYSGGWRTSDNDMTMQWNLVDIVGLLSDREYIPPAQLPTTLGGWMASLAGQLGNNFKNRWKVDPNYAGKACTVKSADDVRGRKCGDILRYICMATGTWPRADAQTGKLTAEPFWNQGAKMDLDNMQVYPTMAANDDLAVLTFKLYDGKGTIYNVSGNATSSSQTLSVDNPFIHTQAEALTSSRQILSQYGGLKLETTGRGNPASEIGDVDTIQLDESTATTARRMEQGFTFTDGFLTDCRSVLLQADGSYLFTERAVFTADGTFHVPAGVSQVRLILADGGQGGGMGQSGYAGGSGNIPGGGTVSGEGNPGADGLGGRIWSGVVPVNPDTDYPVHIGAGGLPALVPEQSGQEGQPSTFGVHSSAEGRRYSPSFTDIASGSAYGRTGVEAPIPGTGDGGQGGKGGSSGAGHWEAVYWPDGRPRGWEWIEDVEPGEGSCGMAGASGVCVIWWDKEARS